MGWKEDIEKNLADEQNLRKYNDLLLKQVNERLFYSELALKALIRIVTIDKKFVSPKEYTTICDKVYADMEEESKKAQAEAALRAQEAALDKQEKKAAKP